MLKAQPLLFFQFRSQGIVFLFKVVILSLSAKCWLLFSVLLFICTCWQPTLLCSHVRFSSELYIDLHDYSWISVWMEWLRQLNLPCSKPNNWFPSNLFLPPPAASRHATSAFRSLRPEVKLTLIPWFPSLTPIASPSASPTVLTPQLSHESLYFSSFLLSQPSLTPLAVLQYSCNCPTTVSLDSLFSSVSYWSGPLKIKTRSF